MTSVRARLRDQTDLGPKEEDAYINRLEHLRSRHAEAIRFAASRGTSRRTLISRYGADLVDVVLGMGAR